MKVAIIGAGWAGCAAAIEATRLNHQVTWFEASRTLGGRARHVELVHAGQSLPLDNGQHILLGAYNETLQLMQDVGVDVQASFLRIPLTLQFANGNGLRLPLWPAPLDALAGMVSARGWSWADKVSLLKVVARWRLHTFECAPQLSVTDICQNLTPHVMTTLIEPLCVSALNTPPERASGQVFLRVLHDSLFATSGGSNLLLPRLDLSALLPNAAYAWLHARGGELHRGTRVQAFTRRTEGWQLHLMQSLRTEPAPVLFDKLIFAGSPADAIRLVQASSLSCESWLADARNLEHEAIATVYAMAPGAVLPLPMLALHTNKNYPAQFVFDRGQLGGPSGLLAFVISASTGDSARLAEQIRQQAVAQLGLYNIEMLQTISEKRATFACTPGLRRPAMQLVPGVLVCGDYVQGPYPATLEGAVRSGLQAAQMI